jgi:flagellar motor protein MotB
VENVEDVEVREAMKSVQGTWKVWLLVLLVGGLGGYGVYHLREQLEIARQDVAGADARATKKHAELLAMKQGRTELETRLEELQKEIAALAPIKQQAELDARTKEEARTKLQALSDTLKESLKGDAALADLRFEIEEEKLHIEIADKVLFDGPEPVISKRGEEVLSKLAPEILKSGTPRLEVAGHNDVAQAPDKVKATIATAWELSALHAASVARHLVEKAKVKDSNIAVSAFGASRPAEKGATPKARARNKRVELVVEAPPVSAQVSPPTAQ